MGIDEIRSLVARLVQTTDHNEMTVKGIRIKLKEELDVEAGVDYEKAWLKDTVDELLQAERAPAASAEVSGEPPAEPEPPAAEPAEAPPLAPVAAPRKKAAPKKAAAAADPDDSRVTSFGLGTVLWAKRQGAKPRACRAYAS